MPMGIGGRVIVRKVLTLIIDEEHNGEHVSTKDDLCPSAVTKFPPEDAGRRKEFPYI